MIGGIVAICLGLWGMSAWWVSFGLVMRGIVPFGLLAFGLLAMIAGFRQLSDGGSEDPALDPQASAADDD